MKDLLIFITTALVAWVSGYLYQKSLTKTKEIQNESKPKKQLDCLELAHKNLHKAIGELWLFKIKGPRNNSPELDTIIDELEDYLELINALIHAYTGIRTNYTKEAITEIIKEIFDSIRIKPMNNLDQNNKTKEAEIALNLKPPITLNPEQERLNIKALQNWAEQIKESPTLTRNEEIMQG